MNLRDGEAFWSISNGLIDAYPPLETDLNTDVVVIGAGITGALVAYQLARVNVGVIVLDKRDVAHGSTSASTALLQYEIDTHLTDLTAMIGEERATRAYQLCLEAIQKVETLTRELRDDCGFARRESLYYASSNKDAATLPLECEARAKAGIRLELWDAGQIQERYGFDAPAALFSYDGAEVDPYRLAYRLLDGASKCGARVYDRTQVLSWKRKNGAWQLKTNRGSIVRAKQLVFATGYEAKPLLEPRTLRLRNSYALVSEPMNVPLWHRASLIWETARPYLYIRTTADNRVLVGGEDEPWHDLSTREERIPKKQRRLEQKFKALFPHIPLETAFAWAGTFGETKDGLAYIGQRRDLPDAHFALGYGGNGITYSVIASELIRDAVIGRKNPDAEVFGFERRGPT
jgi:glycine/D-amino acid oxidase-like deaminating enzyme